MVSNFCLFIRVGVVVVLTVCFSGCVGGMLSGQMISLKDGEIYPFEIQTSYGTGKMTAFNPSNGEKFIGQYTAVKHGGGWSRGTIYNAQMRCVGTVSTFSPPPDATARGYLKGDGGTVIQIYLEINPGIRPTGCGEGIDNKGNKYQVQF